MRSLSGPATYQQVSQATGLKSPKTCLSKLKRKGLVDNTGDNQWVLTTKGVKQLNEQEQQPLEKPLEKAVLIEEMPVTSEGIFRKVGQKLWFSSIRDQDRLDAIIYYVGQIAGFSNPTKIWNALITFRLTPRVKYTWIAVFLTEVGQRMPEEIEEKYAELLGNGLT